MRIKGKFKFFHKKNKQIKQIKQIKSQEKSNQHRLVGFLKSKNDLQNWKSRRLKKMQKSLNNNSTL